MGLALPVVAVQVGQMFLGVVDTVMVGRVSPTDLAAVALGNLYWFGAVVFGLGTLLALDPVISQAVGARDDRGISRGLQRGIVLAAVLAAGATVLIVPSEPILRLLRQPAEVVPVAAGYTLAALAGVFPFYVYIVFRQTLQAMGRVAPVVWTVVAANLANVGFNWVLVYGNLGFPALGAVGAGWASSLSRWLMALGILWAAWPLLGPRLVPFRRSAFAAGALGRMMRLGLPIGVQVGVEFGAFAVVGLLMGLLGTLAVASHQVALNLAALAFMVPLGVAQAAAVLVGRAVGRVDPPAARRAAGAGLLTGGAFMVSTAALFTLLPGPLARIYSSDPGVVALAALLLPVAGVFQVFDGLQVVASAVLRGIGDTRVPMLFILLGFWLVGFPVSLLLGFALDVGPVGLWWGLAAGLGAVAVLLLLRVRVRFAGDLRRIILEEEGGGAEGAGPRESAAGSSVAGP